MRVILITSAPFETFELFDEVITEAPYQKDYDYHGHSANECLGDNQADEYAFIEEVSLEAWAEQRRLELQQSAMEMETGE